MSQLPKGIIYLLQGSIANIPNGFVLCDGNNDTPDLRDKFIVGSGTTYNPGDTGGGDTHTHPFTGNGHTHELPGGNDIYDGTAYSETSESANCVGTTDQANNLPPYYALAYIMKT